MSRLKLSIVLSFIIILLISPELIFSQTSIAINKGAKYTTSRRVELHLSSIDAIEMMISNEASFSNAIWEPFQRTIVWELSEGDEAKIIYIKFRRENGKITKMIFDSIILDTTPPQNGSIRIGNGTYTNHTINNMLDIYSEDARMMIISNDENFRSKHWEPYFADKIWSLLKGDGRKRVYIKFRDDAGNESDLSYDDIILDTKPPKNGTIEIAAQSIIYDSATHNKYLKHRQAVVDLRFHADEARYIMISNDKSFLTSRWAFYKDAYYDWTLNTATEGIHEVFVKFRDKARNESAPISDKVIIDTRPPVDYRIKIANKKLINREKVDLKLFARDAKYMMVSIDSTFKNLDWEPYVTRKKWVFDKTDGVKVIYAIFKDIANNVSKHIFDKIKIDRTPPYEGNITLNNGLKTTDQPFAFVRSKVKEATLMEISTDSTFVNSSWRNYYQAPYKVLFTPDGGIKHVFARFKDNAGNVSKTVSANINLIISPINCKMKIQSDLGSQYCNDPNRKVRLKLFAQRATEMKISNNVFFTDTQWEPYATSKEWFLDDEDGLKQVFVKYKSATGTETKVLKDKIYLDRKGPTEAGVRINRGAESTREYYFSVEVKANDAYLMQISQDSTLNKAHWRGYVSLPIKVNMQNTEGGYKYIYVRFKDERDNISEIVKDSIQLEIVPINSKIVIKEDSYCIHPEGVVTLILKSQKAQQMMISNNASFSGSEWMPFKKILLWNLEGKDEVKSVYAKFRSVTKTESKVVKDKIMLDRQPPSNNNIKVQIGKSYFNSYDILVTASSKDAELMQITENATFLNAVWRRYTNRDLKFTTSSGEGKKIIYARFIDPAGNISETVSGSVIIDKTPPKKYTFEINQNETFTNTTEINLRIKATGANYMRVSNNRVKLASSNWIDFQKNLLWKLTAIEDNRKDVFIQFKDNRNNLSKVISTFIEVDRHPPIAIGIRILNQGKYCTNQLGTVNLKIKAYATQKMMISNNPDFSEREWIRYKTNYNNWILSKNNGEKKIFIKFADDVGNESESISTSIILDNKAPNTVQVTINNNKTLTKDSHVTLDIKADDVHDIEMRVSNSPVFNIGNVWEKYQPTKEWDLDPKDGLKKVYMKFRDDAGNISQLVSDSIRLDTHPPLFYNFKINHGRTAVKGVKVVLSSDVRKADFMQVSNTSNFEKNEWKPLIKNIDWELPKGNGLKIVYVRYKDDAGNVTQTYSARITVYDTILNFDY